MAARCCSQLPLIMLLIIPTKISPILYSGIFFRGYVAIIAYVERPLMDAGCIWLASAATLVIMPVRLMSGARFNAAWPHLSEPKFDHRFKRMWEPIWPIVKEAFGPVSLMLNKCC